MTPLQSLSVQNPGSSGLDYRSEDDDETLSWCTVANNAVFDSLDRLSSRNGWVSVTAPPIAGTPKVQQVFEYIKNSGEKHVISCANNRIYTGTAVLTDVTGNVTVHGDDWQFQNFNGKVVGWQQGHDPIYWDGVGNFKPITVSDGGVIPKGNAVLSAFGRLWALDDSGTVVGYCAVLDETRWNTINGAGTIDLKSNIASARDGFDTGVGLAEFGGNLIVLMKRTILVYGNATFPNNLALMDSLREVGCVARDTICNIGDDLLFLNRTGIVGLQRAIQFTTLPMQYYTTRIRDTFVTEMINSVTSQSKAVFNPTDGFYLLYGSNGIYCFDVKKRLDDGTLRITKWDSIPIRSAYYSISDNVMYIGSDGVIGRYGGYTDNGVPFKFEWISAWTTAKSDVIKIPKSLQLIAVHSGRYSITATINYDYGSQGFSTSVQSGTASAYAEYGSALYGVSKYGSNTRINSNKFNLALDGSTLQFGISVMIDKSPFALQQLKLFFKTGRLAR